MPNDELPPVSNWLQDGFHRFIRPLLRRHFHAIAIERESLNQLGCIDASPVIVYANHPSWWDPLVSHFLNRVLFSPRQFYAPIDAEALQKYRVFGKLGFYGVKMSTTHGAASFLKQSRRILDHPQTAIWMTPEGKFADPRDHSTTLMPGLSHLSSRMENGHIIPLALEYVFWDERLPVCLTKLGQPFDVAANDLLTKPEWATALTDRLRQTQRDLAALSTQRCSDPFESLLSGAKGGGLVYDSFRRAKSIVKRQAFDSSHGEQFK
tara:strand:- start:116126 stop:116920 length:795 start_codon:yes stop_codon:yes gene_type:complete